MTVTAQTRPDLRDAMPRRADRTKRSLPTARLRDMTCAEREFVCRHDLACALTKMPGLRRSRR